MSILVGRHNEKEIINQCVQDNKSHFIAIYGRRRVGKTFLIRQYFGNQFDFYVTGLANGDMKSQLVNFHLSLMEGVDEQSAPQPSNWIEAFHQLKHKLEKSVSPKKIIFIDELPWLDTPRSGFLSGLEYFWNSCASARNDIILIGCGSAASWMINKLINNKRGLFNRVTRKIKLQPFTLKEVESYLHEKKYFIDRYQIVQLYMVFGGIPFYLDLIDTNRSVAQNIERLCFSSNAPLKDEYYILFKSLFDNSDTHQEIVEVLSGKRVGLPRIEIANKVSIGDGGGLTRALSELEASDFIRKYRQFGKKSRETTYQLTDLFTLFYHNHIKNNIHDENYWINQINSPGILSWQGNAFEMVCLLHTDAIKNSLGISGVQTSISTWWGVGAQIDLVIDRKDQVINLVEIKFSNKPYKITKAYGEKLRNKLSSFYENTKSRKSLWITMITTYGLERNMYTDTVQQVLTIDDLFMNK